MTATDLVGPTEHKFRSREIIELHITNITKTLANSKAASIPSKVLKDTADLIATHLKVAAEDRSATNRK